MRNLLIIVLLFNVSFAELGIDLSTATSQASFECFLKEKYDFLVLRAYRSFGSNDPNAPQTIAAARKAGFKQQNIGVYMFPCSNNPQKPARDQVSSMLQLLKNSEYSSIWVDVETNTSPKCQWSETDFDKNCNFMEEIVNTLKAQAQSAGKKIGIYASKYMWGKIFGSSDKCAKFSAYPLWYPRYDLKPDFSDWSSFAGWQKPLVKQFKGTTTLCSAGVDLNFRA